MSEESDIGGNAQSTRRRASSRIEFDSVDNIQASSSLKLENLSDAKLIKPNEMKTLVKIISELE